MYEEAINKAKEEGAAGGCDTTKAQQSSPMGLISGSLGQSTCGNSRAPMRLRLAIGLESAQQQRERNSNMRDLQRLFEKNPDVARILELIEELGGI